jgi:hypothetical protein
MGARSSDDQVVDNLKPDEHRGFIKKIEAGRSICQKEAQDVGALYKNYEKLGGNRAAMQLLIRFKKMGADRAGDIYRSLSMLMALEGLLPEADLVDAMEAEAPAKPAAKATTKAAAKKKSTEKRVSTLKARVADKEADRAAADLAKPDTGSNVISPGFGGYKPLVSSDEEARKLERATGLPH